MPGVWKDVWKGVGGIKFGKEPYMWKFYEMLLKDCDLRGKKVLELGCGTGINTVLMAARGARVTMLDSSREALLITRRVLSESSQEGEIVHGDALDHGFSNDFDIVHSEGVIEHFIGKERQLIVDSHSRALKKGGRAVMIVPNTKCAPYRIGKFLAEKTGTWIHGPEYPYSEKELRFRVENSGMVMENMMGGELLFSLGWLFSPLWLTGGKVLRKSIEQPADPRMIRLNYGNHMANRWGRVIAAVSRKP
jgi:2-polyprenyl-3-methyl-5-hydroxy-6-metoxy-1,4-benzoquinol methylase